MKNAVKNISHRKNLPLHIEFNLTDYCNLNCRGCTHYSPLAPAHFQELEELEMSMKHISTAKNADIIKGVYLIGGETLLYPQLKEAIRLAGMYFPNAEISIFTNGLLIPKMDEEFWELCRSNNCTIAITRYPVKFDYDKIEDICSQKRVKYIVFGDRGDDDSFFKFPLDPAKRQNRMLAHFRCASFGCVTVDKGKIFPCSISACVGHLNRKFGTDFKWEKGDYIETEDLKDAKEIMRLRDRSVPFCGYCRHHEVREYAPSRREAEEWVAEN